MNHTHEINEIRRLMKIVQENKKYQVSDFFDVGKLSKEDVDSITVDLSIFVRNNGYSNKLFYTNGNTILSETATNTLPVADVKKELQEKLKFNDWQILEEKGANNIQLILLYVDYAMNTEIIIKQMEACGWSKSFISQPTLMFGRIVKAIAFDPITQPNVNQEVRQLKYLFHWTPAYNSKNIDEFGLLPKSENQQYDYPPKVHLIKENATEQQKIYLCWQLFKTNHNQQNTGHYTLYQIDVEKVPNDVDFFYDPRCQIGYYTVKPIPKDCILKIGTIQFGKYDNNYVLNKYKINYL